MSGIRIKKFFDRCTEKDVRVHFAKPDNGGGKIFAIYCPVLEGVAVVLFEDDYTAETVVAHKHELNGEEVIVEKLPINVFETVEARLTAPVTAFLQATDEVRDEMEYHAKVEFVREKGIIVGVRGNWYLLEWFWARIRDCMSRQKEELAYLGTPETDLKAPDTADLSMKRGLQSEDVSQRGSFLTRKGETLNIQNPMRQANTYDYKTAQSGGPQRSEPNSPGETPVDRTPLFPAGDLGMADLRLDSKGASEQSFNVARHTVTADPTNTAFQAKTGSSNIGATDRLRWREPMSPVGLKDEDDAISDNDELDSDRSDEEELNGALRSTRPKRIENIADLPISDTEVDRGRKIKIQIQNDNPDDPRTLDFEFGPISVSVYTGMITMAETDAIVNAANGSLAHYGGVAYAIAEAAGPEMQKQCDEYVYKQGSLRTTEVMHTCAGGRISSKVKYIIHAVGPVWSSVFEDKSRRELTLTFLNCLQYGNDTLKIRSISMPVISSGVFGCPLEVSVRCFFNAVQLFISDHLRGTPTLQEVHLVNKDGDGTVSTVLELRGLVVQDMECLLAKARREVAENSTERLFGSPTEPTRRDTAYAEVAPRQYDVGDRYGSDTKFGDYTSPESGFLREKSDPKYDRFSGETVVLSKESEKRLGPESRNREGRFRSDGDSGNRYSGGNMRSNETFHLGLDENSADRFVRDSQNRSGAIRVSGDGSGVLVGRQAGSSSQTSRLYPELERETYDTRRFTSERHGHELGRDTRGSSEEYLPSRNVFNRTSNQSPTSPAGYIGEHTSTSTLSRATNAQGIPGSTSRSPGPPTMGLQSIPGGSSPGLSGLRSPLSPSLTDPSMPRTAGRPLPQVPGSQHQYRK